MIEQKKKKSSIGSLKANNYTVVQECKSGALTCQGSSIPEWKKTSAGLASPPFHTLMGPNEADNHGTTDSVSHLHGHELKLNARTIYLLI